MLTRIWEMVAETFSQSPFLACAMVLVIWLARCWWFRVVEVGRKSSYPDGVLRAFEVDQGGQTAAVDLYSLYNSSATASEGEQPDADGWTVGEIYLIYSALVARGQAIKFATGTIIFAGFALVVMQLAQPTSVVSLAEVANILGMASIVALSILGVLAISLAWNTAHKIPTRLLVKPEARTIILFAW